MYECVSEYVRVGEWVTEWASGVEWVNEWVSEWTTEQANKRGRKFKWMVSKRASACVSEIVWGVSMSAWVREA